MGDPAGLSTRNLLALQAVYSWSPEETLCQDRTLFEEIYEQSPDAMLVVDDMGKIERVNAHSETLFGFPREGMLGQPVDMLLPERLRDQHLLHPIDYVKRFKAMPMGLNLSLFGRRADGSEFPADITLSPIRVEQRQLVLAVVRDITERKRQEAHMQLLMQEVDHRAKNILNVVRAIVHQTITSSLEEFITRFGERIQSLNTSHNLLVRSTWKSIPLRELVCSQLAHFGDLLDTRIAVSGPDLRITATAAQAIGLAVHELATNAGKYGALSTAAGQVDVRWQVDSDLFMMSWSERGGPLVEPPDQGGFGTLVITSLLKQSLDGEVQLNFAPAGLAWRVACPAANVLEPVAALAGEMTS
jgi:PAS domain S-box-containing protein